MATFKFGEIKVNVHRMEPDPLHKDNDFYAVSVSHADTFIETIVKKAVMDRTAGTYYAIAMFSLNNIFMPAMEPEHWAQLMQEIGEMSQEDIDGMVEAAANFKPYLEEAGQIANARLFLYQEHFEKGVGPYDPTMGRKR